MLNIKLVALSSLVQTLYALDAGAAKTLGRNRQRKHSGALVEDHVDGITRRLCSTQLLECALPADSVKKRVHAYAVGPDK